MSKLNKPRLIFGLYLLVLIVAAEVLLKHFELPGWPAFMVMIFFFVEHMDGKKISQILVGGLFGLASVIGAGIFIRALAPSLGLEGATILFVVVIVYAIVAFGEVVPLLFNNYAFMYLTVGGVVAKAAAPTVPPIFLWMAMEFVGGIVLIAGIIAIGKIMEATGTAPPVEVPAEATHG